MIQTKEAANLRRRYCFISGFPLEAPKAAFHWRRDPKNDPLNRFLRLLLPWLDPL